MMISRLLTHLEEDFLKIEEVLQQLAGTFSAADLYAFAKENDEGQFKVNYAAGKEAHLLLNAVFSQGDGFLDKRSSAKIRDIGQTLPRIQDPFTSPGGG